MQHTPSVREEQLRNGQPNRAAAPDAALAEFQTTVAQAYQLVLAAFKRLQHLPERTCQDKDSCQGRHLNCENETPEQRDSPCPCAATLGSQLEGVCVDLSLMRARLEYVSGGLAPAEPWTEATSSPRLGFNSPCYRSSMQIGSSTAPSKTATRAVATPSATGVLARR